MNYAEIAFQYLTEHGRCTHKSLLVATNGNCSYSILRDMKLLAKVRGIEITESWHKNPVTKRRYKEYEVA